MNRDTCDGSTDTRDSRYPDLANLLESVTKTGMYLLFRWFGSLAQLF